MDARTLIARGWYPHWSRRSESERSEKFARWFRGCFGCELEWPRMVLCDWSHPDASEFTLTDALMRATHGDAELMAEAEEWLVPMTPTWSASIWSEQDGRTQADVLRLLDVAVVKAKQRTIKAAEKTHEA